MRTSISILIVEDEAIIAEDIRNILQDLSFENCFVAYNFEEALGIIESANIDLVITDIILSGQKDGVDLAKLLKEKYQIPFIYITSHADKLTVERATSHMPLGYILKPFQQEDLYITLKLALNQIKSSEESANALDFVKPTSVFIKEGSQHYNLNFSDLMWLKSEGNYIELHTVTKRIVLRLPMKEFMDKLPEDLFIRVHKSYAVNKNHIKTINYSSLFVGADELPIGRNYRDQLMSTLNTI